MKNLLGFLKGLFKRLAPLEMECPYCKRIGADLERAGGGDIGIRYRCVHCASYFLR